MQNFIGARLQGSNTHQLLQSVRVANVSDKKDGFVFLGKGDKAIFNLFPSPDTLADQT